MYTIRTNSSDKDFITLVNQLDLYLNNGRLSFLKEYNNIKTIKHAIVVYNKLNRPIGCGAIRQYNSNTMEIKRMFVTESERGNDIAKAILKELEQWAIELNTQTCILETGKDMLRAISFYQKNGYEIIDNYEPYTHNEKSICFEKQV